MAEKKQSLENIKEEWLPFKSGTNFVAHFCEYCFWVQENKDRVDNELKTEEQKESLEHESAIKVIELLLKSSDAKKDIQINNAMYHLPLQRYPAVVKLSFTILHSGQQMKSKKK